MRRLPAIVAVLVPAGAGGAYAGAGAALLALRGGYAASGAARRHPPARRCAPDAAAPRPKQGAFKLPRVRHVFVIVLENEDYASTFGEPSADPYLARRCPAEGALLEDYYATGHESNDNYISLVSGQPPNPDNQADCQDFNEFPARAAQLRRRRARDRLRVSRRSPEHRHPADGHEAQVEGLQQDMGNDPNREAAACGHPATRTTRTKPRKRSKATATPRATTRSCTSSR